MSRYCHGRGGRCPIRCFSAPQRNTVEDFLQTDPHCKRGLPAGPCLRQRLNDAADAASPDRSRATHAGLLRLGCLRRTTTPVLLMPTIRVPSRSMRRFSETSSLRSSLCSFCSLTEVGTSCLRRFDGLGRDFETCRIRQDPRNIRVRFQLLSAVPRPCLPELLSSFATAAASGTTGLAAARPEAASDAIAPHPK